MNILILMKRFGSGKDMLTEQFGRHISLCKQLSKKHSIIIHMADYTKKEKKHFTMNNIQYYCSPFTLVPITFIHKTKQIIEKHQIQVIVGATDPLFSCIGYYLAQKYKLGYINDIQDNYEIYASYKIPFIRTLDRYIAKKSICTCASAVLAQQIVKQGNTHVQVIYNGFDPLLFKPIQPAIARKQLRKYITLPVKKKIIAYSGNYIGEDGAEINFLLTLYNRLRIKHPEVILFLVGTAIYQHIKKLDRRQVPQGVYVIESVAYLDLPVVINSADIAVFPYLKNKFTSVLETPFKLVEYMSCNIPIVCSDVGTIKTSLPPGYPYIVTAGDIDGFAHHIEQLLAKHPTSPVSYRHLALQYSWEHLAQKFEQVITSAGPR